MAEQQVVDGFQQALSTSEDGTDIHNLKTELTAMPTDIVEDIDADMAPFPGVVEE